jgi:hypothetical protein
MLYSERAQNFLMSNLASGEKESALLSRLLLLNVRGVSQPGQVSLPHFCNDCVGKGVEPLLSLSGVDDIFIERLSMDDLKSLRSQLLYLVSCMDRVDAELGKSSLAQEMRQVCLSLQVVIQRYVVMVIQCAELFGLEPRSLSQCGGVMASLAMSNEIPLLTFIKISDFVAAEAGVESAAEFASLFILQVMQRIVSSRSFDVNSEQCSGDVNTIALFLKVSKWNYVAEVISKGALFYPLHLPDPVKLPGQPTSSGGPVHKNVFVLQTSTLVGRLLMPSTVDHVLLSQSEMPKSTKSVCFSNLSRRTLPDLNASLAQARAQLGAVIDSVLSVVQPLIRSEEHIRLLVLKWFSTAIVNSSSRATMGWQQQVAPHGAQLAEHLTSEQAAAQLGGSLQRFRTLTAMQTVRVNGLISSGTALNLAWTIFELCKPIKLNNCGGVDEFFLASTNPIAVELLATLYKESRLGDAERLEEIRSKTGDKLGAFKTHIFWLAVNAIHVLVLPSCKEAEMTIQCASVLHRDKKEGPMNDAFGEFHCFEAIYHHPRFMDALAHVVNLMLVMILKCAVQPSAAGSDPPSVSPSKPFECLDIRHDSDSNFSDSMAVLPSCMLEEIVELLDFYRLMKDVARSNSRDMTDLLDADLFLQFMIWTLGSDKIRNPSIRGKAAKVLIALTKDPRFSSRILLAPYSVRNITPACIRVFSAVEKTKQSYYDIRMHVKFELRIPIQQLFELLLNSEDHRRELKTFVTEFRDDFYRFASQLLNDTTYLLEEGLETLIAIRKKESLSSSVETEQQGEEGTAGLGVERGVEEDDQNAQGQDIYRRSRHDPIEHCRQYMRMGHQTMSTLHQMCKQTCEVLVDDKVVLDQMITSCLDPSLDRLVGPKCLQLKGQHEKNFAFFEFDPKQLLFQILEMYVYLARGDRREKVAKVLSEDKRYYRPETLRKAISIAKREHLIRAEMLKEFEEFSKFTNEMSQSLLSVMDSVEIPDEFLDPIMAELMADPVLLPTSNNIMDKRHIMRIILSDDHDPFNRQPLKPQDLVPQEDLKRRIHQFCATHKIPLDQTDE